ncbi:MULTISPECIES: Glu/Leu/Phe/Val dehydrogenase [Anaerococcus]|uniref:Glutamate dehydrogenase n=1 Tax=Anaerococcus nagyae TaxID=1755241 RepID=A0A3E2TLD2_9FIRM|nr:MULTISPECIES: Glu/Leu/Phe/Val dehydrogenase [Anaerococcus]MBP2069266.1 glutamate dehydrogenase [Anaerococcus nagyae]MDU1828054.1 Glu/Leu/Phe/Val dehydrogenase [Anaerococcus sp.]MDU1864577.1 Glu/Leu/Phe/Val dehydrogenase [Anaerococcus sp.]MDU2353276.1 Glu/Leu/Phe/Val dehydrogenase [Anaerococcus sp.]MDU2565095.1 Glu/Leu/Phe/Val dehydrogenase [Anaerococcus sp.]
MTETLNPLESAQQKVKKACDKLGADPAVYEILKEPERVIEISIPVKMDDGSVKVFKGWRSAHSTAVGPSKGGCRFHPNVNLDEVKALSLWMTFKGGALGLPYGGGKGGVAVDPSELSERELEQVARGYVRGLYKYLGDRIDIPAPDVNTNGQIMSWMVDEYVKLNGDRFDIGTFTGKPVDFSGSQGRNEATGFGVAVVVREAAKRYGLDINTAKIAVQGFGNVGSYTVKNIERQGGKVNAIAEWDKKEGNYALYNEEGFDFKDLLAYKEENHTLIGYPNAEKISEKDFWEGEWDILVPAALENVITKDVAEKLNVKLVCEAANGPTTPEADKVLEERNIPLTPDILTNSGGVLVSYYEWVQNQYGYYWDEAEVEEKQEADMMKAIEGVFAVCDEYDVIPRDGVYMYAIQSIEKAMKLRGWY